MDDPIRNSNHIAGDGAGAIDEVDAAMRRHLVRTDPATGLANRLVLVELLRSLAMPPEPHEMVGGVTVAVEDLLAPAPLSRRADVATLLEEFGRFVADAAPEGGIAASIADGLVLLVLPGRTGPSVQAVAARLRALWMRRAWGVRRMPRPVLTITPRTVPMAAVGGGWLDDLVQEARRRAAAPRRYRSVG